MELDMNEELIEIGQDQKVYLAGPIRGAYKQIEEVNIEQFARFDKKIKDRYKCAVTNPAKLDLGNGATYGDYMRKDIPKLLKCDVLVLLPGWATSQGARLEYRIARDVDMDIFAIRLTGPNDEDWVLDPASREMFW